jgi:hypothetical protein
MNSSTWPFFPSWTKLLLLPKTPLNLQVFQHHRVLRRSRAPKLTYSYSCSSISAHNHIRHESSIMGSFRGYPAHIRSSQNPHHPHQRPSRPQSTEQSCRSCESYRSRRMAISDTSLQIFTAPSRKQRHTREAETTQVRKQVSAFP